MFVRRFLLVVFLYTVGVKSEYVEVNGITTAQSDLSVTIEATKYLSENPKCRSLKSIEEIRGMSKIRRNFFSNLQNLERIRVSGINGIELGAFSHVPNLDDIMITESSLKEIPEGIFDHLEITYVFLVRNGIETIAPGAFNHMPNLRQIDLSWNKLTRWNIDWFFNCPSLFHTNFAHNRIEELPDGAFRNIKTDAVVYLTNNSISRVGQRLFPETKTVHQLFLSYNKIDSFDGGMLDGVEKIEMLFIDHNLITCLTGDFDKIFLAEATNLGGDDMSCDCKRNISDWKKKHPDPQHLIFLSNGCCWPPLEYDFYDGWDYMDDYE